MSKKLTPLRAIRENCRVCSNFQPKEIKNCPITSCNLYLYRFGRNPARSGMGGILPKIISKSATESVKTLKEKE